MYIPVFNSEEQYTCKLIQPEEYSWFKDTYLFKNSTEEVEEVRGVLDSNHSDIQLEAENLDDTIKCEV